MPRLHLLGLVVPLLVLPQTAELRVGPATGSIEEPFSDIFGVAELPDGRVIVADRTEQSFLLADFASRQRRVLGRNGTGPNEYLSAFGVIRWRGDTVLGYDSFGRRLVRFDPQGVIAGTIPLPAPGPNGGLAPPRGRDGDGRLYWDTPRLDRAQMKRMMQASILRWMPGAGSTEMVGEFTDHAEFEHRFRYRPWPSVDAWAVAPDGRIAVLSSAEYRLRWYRDGVAIDSGPAVPHTRLRVGPAERDAFREAKALEPVSGASSSGNGPARTLLGAERARASWPDSLFPDVLPPFEAHAMLMAPSGDLWVSRTGPARQAFARVDVLDPRGRLRATVRLPDRSRLLAIGSRGLYLVRVDDDGLQTLERHAFPVIPR